MIEEDAPDSSKLRALADALFDATDANRDGVITHLELLRALRTNDALRASSGSRPRRRPPRGPEARAPGRVDPSDELEQLWAEMDQNDDITISRAEFHAGSEHDKVLDAPPRAGPPRRATPIPRPRIRSVAAAAAPRNPKHPPPGFGTR